MHTFIALCVALVVLAVGLAFRLRRPTSTSSDDLETLLEKLVPVDERKFQMMLMEELSDKESSRLIKAIQVNARLLVRIGEEVQALHPDSLVVVESLRQTNRAIEWHLGRRISAHWRLSTGGNIARLYRDAFDGLVALCREVNPAVASTLQEA